MTDYAAFAHLSPLETWEASHRARIGEILRRKGFTEGG